MHMHTRVVSVLAIVATAGCSTDARDGEERTTIARTARELYPALIEELDLEGAVVVERVVALTDLIEAAELDPAAWQALPWMPLPGGVRRGDTGVILDENAGIGWPPVAPTEHAGAAGVPDAQVALLRITARIGEGRATYQGLLMRDATEGDLLLDPVLGALRVNTPRAVNLELEMETEEAPAIDAEVGKVEKQEVACDGQPHTVTTGEVKGAALTATCRSWCDTDYVKIQAVAQATSTITCKPNDCLSSDEKGEHGARVDLLKYHDENYTILDEDDSKYITWDVANGQLECDYAWPCTRDYIGVTWEGKTAKAFVYDDLDTPTKVGYAVSTAAHAAVTSHGDDVVFAAIGAAAWAIILTQVGATLVMAGPAFFQVGHSGQIMAHYKVPDAVATAVAVCKPPMALPPPPVPTVDD
jgi:hypothetical protein